MKKLFFVLALLSLAVPVFGAEYRIVSATDGKYTLYAIQQSVNGGDWEKTGRVFGNCFDSLDDAEEYVKAFREIDLERKEAAAKAALKVRADNENLWKPVTPLSRTWDKESFERDMERASEEAARKADEATRDKFEKLRAEQDQDINELKKAVESILKEK